MNKNLSRSFMIFFLLVLFIATATLHAQAKKSPATVAMEGVRVGMSQKEVLALIKEPSEKEKSVIGEFWHYKLPVMSVMFSKNPVLVERLSTDNPLTKVTVDGKKIRVGNKYSEVVALIGQHEGKFVVNKELVEYIWFNESLRLLFKDGQLHKVSIVPEIVWE